ncbi:MAG: ABC transporter ATP-binding protein [Clostridia bacterium]|nr:ABC transporter ATP-binding protein [Clostridia bacterium]
MNSKFIKYLLMDKRFVLMIFLLMLFSSVFAQLVPYFQGLLVDNALITMNQSAIYIFCISIFFVLILDSVCRLFFSSYMLNYGYKAANKMQNNVFKHIIYRPYDFFEAHNTGDILYRTNTYVYDIGNYISKNISDLLMSIARIIMIFIFLFVVEPFFAIILCLLYIFIFIVTYLFSKIIFKMAKSSINTELHRNAVIMQNLEGLETFLAYNTNYKNLENYNKISSNYGKIRKKYYGIYNLFFQLTDFMVCFGIVLVYIIASIKVISLLQIGIVVSVLTYASAMVSPMGLLSRGMANYFETSAIMDMVLEYSGDKKEQTEKVDLQTEKVDIKCKNVCYRNKGNNTDIQNLNLKIKSGEKILLFAQYGSGKTSFTNLLCGLYNVDSGEILYNGIKIQDLSVSSLANLISVTADYVGVFNASVFENVKFAKQDASDEEVLNAIEVSGLKKVADKMKRGIKTRINPAYISEGDKQLISYARIILKNPPVIIVDEVIRDMSKLHKRNFFKSLKEFTKDKTLIYISETENVDFKFDRTIDFNSIKK